MYIKRLENLSVEFKCGYKLQGSRINLNIYSMFTAHFTSTSKQLQVLLSNSIVNFDFCGVPGRVLLFFGVDFHSLVVLLLSLVSLLSYLEGRSFLSARYNFCPPGGEMTFLSTAPKVHEREEKKKKSRMFCEREVYVVVN
jgi:hypothetical protein